MSDNFATYIPPTAFQSDDVEAERIKAYARGWNTAMMGRVATQEESAAFALGYLDVMRHKPKKNRLRMV